MMVLGRSSCLGPCRRAAQSASSAQRPISGIAPGHLCSHRRSAHRVAWARASPPQQQAGKPAAAETHQDSKQADAAPSPPPGAGAAASSSPEGNGAAGAAPPSSGHHHQDGTVAQATSKSEAAGGGTTGSSKDGDEDSDEFENMLLSLDPVTVSVTESIISALVIMVVAGVLGSWLSIDPWSYYKQDGSAALLAAQASMPLVLGMAVLACVPTGVLGSLTAKQRQLLSSAEDDIIVNVPAIDLGPLLFPIISEAAAATQQEQERLRQSLQLQQQQQQPAEGVGGIQLAAALGPDGVPLPAATTRPLPSGLRLFQLWVTKPWCPEFSPPQMAAITASSGLQLAASELLTRGLVVALLAGALREAVASADQTSVLFWNKVFKLTTEGTYRWFGTWVVAAGSMFAVFREAGRMQRWARLVLFRLSQRQQEQKGTQQQRQEQQQQGANVATAAAAAAVVAEGAAAATALPSTSGSGSSVVSEDEADGAVEELQGLEFTGYNQRRVNSLNVSRTMDGFQVELREAEENLAPTQEDGVVWNLAVFIGTAQVIQLALLYGSTGTLLAPLTARLVLEASGNALIRAFARGGPPTLATMTVAVSPSASSDSSKPPSL